jgi:hypothetical protein
MIIENATFKNGTYDKSCELFTDIKIGSINCVGHSEIPNILKCKFCLSHKEENSYFLKIMKEKISIASEVLCNRPGVQQKLF